MSTPDLLPNGKPRRPLRPLHGIPERDRRGREGLLVSALLHGAIVVALLLPPIIATTVEFDENTGGGGPGAAGGGGGGTGGTGGETPMTPERLRYVQVAPIPRAAPEAVTPPVVAPPKPEPEKAPEPVPKPPTPAPPAEQAPSSGPTIPAPGAGGGSGHDGSAGNGPGSGGGVGSGVGTGRGSGTGPGTGGGAGRRYPAMTILLPILPTPVPNRVKPYDLVAVFEVDERGNAKLIAYNPPRDSGYDKKVRAMLADLRFRPGTLSDGTPVRDTVSVAFSARD